MTTLRTAAQQALEALGLWATGRDMDAVALNDLIFRLEAALAEPMQEPVAWRFQSAVGGWAYGSKPPLGSKYPAYPLYTAPPGHKSLSITDLQEALVYTGIIDRDAIDDPDEYDEGSTLAQIDELHRIIQQHMEDTK